MIDGKGTVEPVLRISIRPRHVRGEEISVLEDRASFPYHRCRNSNSPSLIKIKETSRRGGMVAGRLAWGSGPPLSYLAGTIAWDYGPFVLHFHCHLHTHPFHLHPFAFLSFSRFFPLSLSLSFFRRRDRVISGRRNALLSWVLIFFFFFVVFSNGVFSGFLVIVLSNGFSELQGTCLRSRVCSADFVNFVFVNITGLALSSMIFLEGNIENIFFWDLIQTIEAKYE